MAYSPEDSTAYNSFVCLQRAFISFVDKSGQAYSQEHDGESSLECTLATVSILWLLECTVG